MSILRSPFVPLYTNPHFQPGLDALSWWLEQNHYSQHAREAILAHTARVGTPTASAYLEASDEAEASEAFVSALPEVPEASEAWDREDVFLDAGMLADGTHPWPILATGDDDRDAPDDFAAAALEDLDIRPVCGGAPVPTEADSRDFEAWLEQVDTPYPPDDQAEPARADGYDAGTLARIHRALYGRSEPFHA
jgi:hypothetical protein